MEVARLQVAFDATGQPAVQRAIKQTDSDIGRLVSNTERGAARMVNAFSGTGKVIAATFGAVAAIGAGKAALGFLTINANAEQLKVQLDIATGSAERANMVFGELQKMAAATPFEFPELVSASARIESFGLDSLKTMQVIGDTAAGTGKSIDQVTNAYLDAGMGQFVRLQELGIDAAVVGDNVKFKWIENGKEITKEVDKNSTEQIQSTLSAIWNKKYEGAMKKQSRTFNGQLSTLKDNWNLTMGRLTMGFFGFTKDVLSEGNQFFDLFNKKLDQGLDPWHAALSALHVTLDQVLGERAGDIIDATLRGITDGVVGMTRAVSGLVGSLAAGDVSGFFDQLGGFATGAIDWTLTTAVPTVVGWVADVAGDVWSGIKDAAGWAWDNVADLGSFVITAIPRLASDIWGAAGNAYDWFVGEIGLGNRTAGAPISVGDVALTVGRIVLDAAVDLAGKAKAAIEGWFAANPGVKAALDNWTLVGSRPQVEWSIGTSWSEFIGVEIDKEKIEAELDQWTLILKVPSIEVEGGTGGESPMWARLKAELAQTKIHIGPSFAVGAPKAFEGLELVSNALQAVLGPWARGRNFLLKEWNINLGPPTFNNLAIGLGVWLGNEIRKHVPNVSLPSWNLSLPKPNVVMGSLLGNVLGLGGWVAGKIRDAIGTLDVTLPSWDLKLPSPANITNVGGVDLVAQVPLWVYGKVGSIEDIEALLGPWDIKVPTPGFPNITDNIVVINWIEDHLDSLGQFLVSILDGMFSINVPNPLFPNLTWNNVWNWIWSALTALGSFTFSVPININLVPNINTGGILGAIAGAAAEVGGSVPGRARGGFVREPMTLVGERGPELVSLPRGSYVHNAAQTAAMARAGRFARGAGGGDTYYLVDLSNAVVGRGAMQEIERMIADGSVRTYDGRSTANRLAGR